MRARVGHIDNREFLVGNQKEKKSIVTYPKRPIVLKKIFRTSSMTNCSVMPVTVDVFTLLLTLFAKFDATFERARRE